MASHRPLRNWSRRKNTLRRREVHKDRRTLLIKLKEKNKVCRDLYTKITREKTELFYKGFKTKEIDAFEGYLAWVFDNLTAFEAKKDVQKDVQGRKGGQDMSAYRMLFLSIAGVVLLGIWLTGFDKAHWFLYVPVVMLTFAGLTGICPGLILLRTMGFSDKPVSCMFPGRKK